MSESNQTSTEFWKQHLDAWRESGLTQTAYCRHANLKLHRFGYWRRKLEGTAARKPANGGATGGFVPVAMPGVAHASGLILTLPNGIRLEGITSESLSLAHQLLERLS